MLIQNIIDKFQIIKFCKLYILCHGKKQTLLDHVGLWSRSLTNQSIQISSKTYNHITKPFLS